MNKGFTLLETIIYLALFSVLMSVAITAVYTLLQSGTQNLTAISIQEEGMFINRKLSWALSNATTVVTPDSHTLRITRPDLGIQSPLVITEVGGTFVIARGAGASVPFSNIFLTIVNSNIAQIPAHDGLPPLVQIRYTINDVPFVFEMYIKNHAHPLQNTQGYIALIATIIISAVLLVLSVEEGEAGARARFDILGTEAKEQSLALAEGCKDQALALFLSDPTYIGNATNTSSIGICHIFPIVLNSPTPGLITLRVQARVRNSFSNVEFIIALDNINLSYIPQPSKVVVSPAPIIHTDSRKELLVLP